MARLPSITEIGNPAPRAVGGPIASYRTGQVEEATADLGRALSVHADRELDRIDDSRAEDAFNKLREKQMELTLDPERGYTNQRGRMAVERKTPLIEDYGKQYDQAIIEISSGLSTDRQRSKFKQRADAASVGFRSEVLRHTMRETDKHRIEVLGGVLSTETQNAGANWGDQGVIDQARARIEHNFSQIYGKTGIAGEKAKADLAGAMAKVHDSVVTAAMANGAYDYAENYIKSNSNEMGFADIARHGTLLRTMRENRAATGVASEVVNSALPHLAPDDFDRLNNLVRGVESGNRDYVNGAPVTSSKGAKYAQQVMPATAKDPGFGIKPAKDDSPEEYNRVGREYLGAMLKRYNGDVQKALAAYNAGPDKVDSALAAEKNPKGDAKPWLVRLPEETQKYVAKITGQYESGDAGVARPTLQEVKNAAIERAKRGGLSPEGQQKAATHAEAMYNDTLQSLSQQSDGTLTDIMARVDAGEITRNSDLTPQELAVLGQKRTSAYAYIEANSRRGEKALKLSVAGTDFYYTMLTDPVALTSASIADIMALSPEIGNDRVNSLLNQRKDYVNRPESEKAAMLDADQFRAAAVRMGFNPKRKKDKEELILIKDRTEEAITVKQAELKRTLTREEKGDVIKKMMVEVPAVQARYTGVFGGNKTTMTKRGYDIEHPENVVVPEKEKAKIVADARRYGRQLSDTEIRDVYARRLVDTQQGR